MISTLHKAFDAKRYNHIYILLNAANVNCDVTDAQGRTLLMRCAYVTSRREGIALAKALLTYGANKTSRDKHGWNALFHAMNAHNLPFAKLLLADMGFDLNEADNEGFTVLHHCCKNGLSQFCHLLIPLYRKYCLYIDVTDAAGMTALHLACAHGHYDIARQLVYSGKASIQRCDDRLFRNARDWLLASGKFPSDLEPFPPQPKMSKQWANYVISCAKRSATNNKGIHQCATKTAPAKIQRQHGLKRSPKDESVTSTEQGARTKSATATSTPVVVTTPCARAKTFTSALTKSITDDEFKPPRASTAKTEVCPDFAIARLKSAPAIIRAHSYHLKQKSLDNTLSTSDITLETDWLVPSMSQAGARVTSAEIHTQQENSGTFFASKEFQELFRLYTEQSSTSYRQPARIANGTLRHQATCDVTANGKLQALTHHAQSRGRRDTLSSGTTTKARLQRFLRMRRAESLLRSLKTFKSSNVDDNDVTTAHGRRGSRLITGVMKEKSMSDPGCFNAPVQPRQIDVSGRRASEMKTTLSRANHGGSVFDVRAKPARGRYASVDVGVVGVHHV